MNVVKSSSKLNGMFITLYRTQRGAHLTNGKEDDKYVSDNYIFKRWNYFYNPMVNLRLHDHGTGATGANRGFGFANKNLKISRQVQVHNKQYPEFESQSLSEHWYFLNRFLSYVNPDQDACSIPYEQNRSNKFIIGISFEEMSEANMTGVNTKMSVLTTLKLKPCRTLTANEAIEAVFTRIISESVLEIRSDGSVVDD